MKTIEFSRKYKVLPKKHFGFRSKEEKWAYARSRRKSETRLVAFLGTGRCGTGFSANAMRAIGLDVPHQYVGKHGTSSHWMHVDSDWYPRRPHTTRREHVGQMRGDFEFEHIIHIVRNPLKCIPSMAAVFGTMVWEFAYDNGFLTDDELEGLSKTQYAALWWARVNEEIRTSGLCLGAIDSMTVPIEKCKLLWPEIVDMLEQPGGTKYPADVKSNKASKWSQYEPLNWRSMRSAVGVEIYQLVREEAEAYDYVR